MSDFKKYWQAVMRQRAASAAPEAWEKLPQVGASVYCASCGGGRDKSGENFVIAVGFGSADVFAGKTPIISEQEWYLEDDLNADYITLDMVEKVAAEFPQHDWRISMFAPLSEQEYQRQGDGEWVLVRTGEGFA